ncbi:DUF6988 family protein [Verminephrobacter aporrectodeae]|uniref:DUF6988 family protein n=1 Tax=Verminephrobacter aporrectodeae TaxID=1110389 RepID=UPI002244E720|nr:DUF5677 domain-containing protein [Verminephrobacter aporrectodeae]
MLTDKEIFHAVQFVEKLHRFINKLKLPGNNRVLVSGVCFAIAREHHRAIVCLIEEEIFSSAYALFRLVFEAYVRGEWLLRCADDEFVDDFIQRDKEPPKINCMIKELEERNEGFEGFEGFNETENLSQIKSNIWKPSCGWTHTGGDAVRHWITKDGIEPNYKKKDVMEMLSATESIGALATMAISSLSGDKNIAEDILKALEHHFSAQGERGG